VLTHLVFSFCVFFYATVQPPLTSTDNNPPPPSVLQTPFLPRTFFLPFRSVFLSRYVSTPDRFLRCHRFVNVFSLFSRCPPREKSSQLFFIGTPLRIRSPCGSRTFVSFPFVGPLQSFFDCFYQFVADSSPTLRKLILSLFHAGTVSLVIPLLFFCVEYIF